jgi:hypothetical protein
MRSYAFVTACWLFGAGRFGILLIALNFCFSMPYIRRQKAYNMEGKFFSKKSSQNFGSNYFSIYLLKLLAMRVDILAKHYDRHYLLLDE